MTATLIHTLVGWLRLSWHIQPTSQCGGTAEGCITPNLSPPSESISSKPLPQKIFLSEFSYSFQPFAVLSCNWCGQPPLEVCCDTEQEIATSNSSILCCGSSVPFYAKHLKGVLHQLSKFVIIYQSVFKIKDSNEVWRAVVASFWKAKDVIKLMDAKPKYIVSLPLILKWLFDLIKWLPYERYRFFNNCAIYQMQPNEIAHFLYWQCLNWRDLSLLKSFSTYVFLCVIRG